MKLFRSDLERGFQNQFFEIPAEALDLSDIHLSGKSIECILNAGPTPSGFRVSGKINLNYLETCDRCLSEFKDQYVTDLNLILTNKEELINESDSDVVFFPSTAVSVDITPNLRELTLLEKAVKHLCQDECNGLCPHCGINKNVDSCSCTDFQTNTSWGSLKELNL